MKNAGKYAYVIHSLLITEALWDDLVDDLLLDFLAKLLGGDIFAVLG